MTICAEYAGRSWQSCTRWIQACSCGLSSALQPQDDSALREYISGKMKPLVDALERVIALQQRTFGYATQLHCGMVDLVFDLKEALEAARKEL